MIWDDFIPLLTLLTSLVPAVLIFLLPEGRRGVRTTLNMAGAVLKLAFIALMLWGTFHEHRFESRFPVVPGVDFLLRADALAMFFVTLSGVLWFVTTIYAIAYLEGSPNRNRFFGFFSLCVSATVGIALAGNLFTFVMFYELLTLSTYPLVVHRETDVSLRAGRVYLAYTLAGGAVLLFAATWLQSLVPSAEFDQGVSVAGLGIEHYGALRVIFVLLIAGLGVKAALVPLHGWLPLAMVAPAPVSALLHAVAVVKAGAFGIVRVVYDVYGIDFAHALALTTPLAIWASITIVYGSVRALFQDDLKRRLAFSTVSQVSFIALGVAVFGPSSTVGGVVHLVHQGLMKITLFFCAGNLAETLGIHKITEMHGVARRMPWTMAAFTVGALGMMGVPPVVGFISKWYLAAGAIEASQFWVLIVLATSSALNAAYFLPVLYVAWFRAPRGKWLLEKPRRSIETSWGLLLPTLTTAALAVSMGLLAGVPFSPLQWALLIVDRVYGRAVVDWGFAPGSAAWTFDSSLVVLTLVAPLVAVSLLLTHRFRAAALWFASLAALPAVVLAFCGQPGVAVDLPWVLLRMHLGLDMTGQVFLIFTALLWLLAGVYARGYLANDPQAPRFFRFFLLTMVGNLGLVLSRDMASFYLFFAIMSFSSYGLIVHSGDGKALRAGRVYMRLVVFGEIALFVGMSLATVARGSLLFDQGVAQLASAGTLNAIVGLCFVGFGIKAGLLPLHAWLPLAHPAAPTPASAVLSGAMIEAGLLGWLRFLPFGQVSLPGWAEIFLIVGLATAFYGAIVGVTQSNAKVVLAYSSISQMGLLALGVGAGLMAPAAWPVIAPAVLVYALQHGLNKGCLFLSIGVAPTATAASWRCRLVKAGIVLPALALAGTPLTIGAVSKSELKYALSVLPAHWNFAFDVLLPLATVGTSLLMARFLYLVWPDSDRAAERVTSAVLVSWLALLVSSIAAVWLIPASAGVGAPASLLMATVTWDNVWPLCLGGAIACSAWRMGRAKRTLNFPAIPAGDVLVVWQQGSRSINAWVRLLIRQPRRLGWTLPKKPRALFWRARLDRLIQDTDTALDGWPWVGVVAWILLVTCLLLSRAG